MAKKSNSEKTGLADDYPIRPVSTSTDESQPRDSDFLHLLEGVFLAPMLSLLQVYLRHSNGNKKTIENCTLDFRAKHSKVWKTFFIMDFLFRLIYMGVVLVVVIRGLAIGDFIKQLVDSGGM